ncbi:FimV/HubP family polar landmark protein [Oceanisphaera sp. IT1-181]|uniref:FimV/HubP family polar landmark protein n=1 Tax=Oceanisphaera sp. IT1-181 TaxID=3081199 RepID=UPI0029CA94BA|nr:FimV/HubP family polar landmark protein [Oceanisphaera sp. IT1-181]
MIKRLKPYLGVGLAAWVASSAVLAQGDFYIELRGPESADSAQTREPDRPAAVPQASPAQQTRPIQQIGTIPAPAATAAGQYGPVRSTDTLWTIAEKYTRSPVTVQQTMVALYHLNPRAFVRGNINNLQRGVQLRLPTASQARQRSAGEAQTEFSRLTRQGNRRVVQGATAPARPQVAVAQVSSVTPKPAPKPTVQPAAQPIASTNTAAPTAARPPVTEPTPAANGLTEPKAATNGLTAPKAAPIIAANNTPATPEQAEDMALNRLQLQLMDELREQVSMSNEQLASLADNNQALRQHLAQLSAEVAALKANTDERSSQDVAPEAEPKGWLQELLNNPINLALILILPALLLLALFTLWWRNRERRDLAAQEQALTENSMIMDDERDEFDDLFATADDSLDDEADAFASPEPIAEQDIDEDAFARFLEEQQQLEEAEAGRQVEVEAPQPVVEPELIPEPELTPELEPEVDEDPLFEDTLFEDEQFEDQEFEDEPLEDDIPKDIPLEDQLFEDEIPLTTTTDSLSNEELDDLFNPPTTAEAAPLTADVAEQAPIEQDEPPARLVDDWPAESIADMESELESAPDPEPYVSVDELMADAERGEGPDPDRERKLDLELDDYASVIGQGQGVDIDIDEGGMSGQLDLARAYLEIDDIDSARDLLNEALERGNAEQQRDAKKLLQRLDKRG